MSVFLLHTSHYTPKALTNQCSHHQLLMLIEKIKYNKLTTIGFRFDLLVLLREYDVLSVLLFVLGYFSLGFSLFLARKLFVVFNCLPISSGNNIL